MNSPTEEDKKEVFYRLKNGIIISSLNECPTDSGLYLLCPNFDIGDDYKWLKVGMTVDDEGLKERIGKHYRSGGLLKKIGKRRTISINLISEYEQEKLKPEDIKSSSSILGKHLFFDRTFSKRFNLDFTKQGNRKEFLKQNCFFRVLPLPHFNWKTTEEKKLKRKELKKYEHWIEKNYRYQIRYIDKVMFR